jgi:hypothetical protein
LYQCQQSFNPFLGCTYFELSTAGRVFICWGNTSVGQINRKVETICNFPGKVPEMGGIGTFSLDFVWHAL